VPKQTNKEETPAAAGSEVPPDYGPSLGKITAILALTLVRGFSQADQATSLTRVGYKPSEISGLLGISSHQVSVLLHQSKKKKKQKKQTTKAKD
jgi:hypothetical protein